MCYWDLEDHGRLKNDTQNYRFHIVYVHGLNTLYILFSLSNKVFFRLKISKPKGIFLTDKVNHL